MQITINIDPNVPRWLKRVAMYAGVPALLAVGSAVYADVTVTTFSPKEGLSAQKMNDNFSALKNAINKPIFVNSQATVHNTYSLAATVCGATPSETTGNMGGFAAGKISCETACGSPSAHVCTSHEVAMTMATGGMKFAPVADYEYRVQGDWAQISNMSISSCNGWTSADAAQYAQAWTFKSSTQGNPDTSSCSIAHKMLCCD